LALCLLHIAAPQASGHGYEVHGGYAKQSHCEHGGLFGWRSYTKEERRNFPRCYAGYERYYGGFHANYFRDYPVDNAGLNNDRYGWGSGWAW
jgi:hypothetical protein